MKKSILLISLLIVMSLSLVSAATYQVDNRNLGGNICSDLGNETYFCTIQAAVDYANDGSTINVAGGTYTEQVIINKNLKLKNTGDAKINAPSSRRTFTFTESTSTWDPIIIVYGGSETSGAISGNGVVNVDIEGFEIDGLDKTPSGRYVGILYRNVNGNIKDNTIKHMKIDGSETFGISVYGKSNVLVEGNDISGYARGGIGINGDLDSSSKVTPSPDPIATVKENKVTGPGLGVPVTWAANGIQMGYGAKGTIENNEVTGNGWPGTEWAGTGILVVDTKDVTIKNNEVHKNEQAIGAGDFFGNAVERIDIMNNNIYENEWGISIFNEISDVTITGNKIIDTVSDGIDVYKYSGHSEYPQDIKINFNEIIGNGPDALWVQVPADEIINAENNYWGDCTGPGGVGSGNGDKITIDSGQVDYTPWLGACVDVQYNEDSCILDSEDVEVKANMTYSACLGNVWIGVNTGSGWQNYSAIGTKNPYSYKIDDSLTEGGNLVQWRYYVDDCYGHVDEGAIQEFTPKHKTDLIIDPSTPNGLEGWYKTEPLFTFNNDDHPTTITYRWDGLGPFTYNGTEFGVADAPNGGDGYLELTWWSDLCEGEPEQTKAIKVDQLPPQITNVNPVESSLIATLTPTISATIKEPYQTNSGVDVSSITLTIDSAGITDFNYVPGTKRLTYFATGLTEGVHDVVLTASDYAGNTATKEWNFTINMSSVDLRIINPPAGISNQKRQLLEVLLNEKVAKLDYMDENDKKPTFKSLCRNCEIYNKTKTFNEGQHNLVVRATNYAGAEINQTVSFFIDSVTPKIISQTPKKKSYGDGTFVVKYNEENPVSVILSYNQTGIWKTETKTDCPGGKNKICSFYIGDLSQGDLEYNFEIIDITGSNVKSKTDFIKIDTIAPLMTITSPQSTTYTTKKVPFDIVIDEASDLYYMDHTSKNKRWVRLASKTMDYKKTVTFQKGEHELEFMAVDRAGNEAVLGPINFEVI
ncbi:MAG: right-handed parallel beta-helix repeat-containing protein [Candidatus Nanoarchaeia archaeon]|nr:right-handed parallel beta-helix repeat-containing protein [Candidatus Nanoarchaeia archaeon]